MRAPGSTERVYYQTVVEMHHDRYDGDWKSTREVVTTPGMGNLVSSEISGRKGLHAPALDLDLPAYLIPSSTPGHSHLYIDVEIPWWRYRVMLWAMAYAGVIERGYYRASVARKGTHLRQPGVKK
jgi:hypothetical protein